MPGGGSIIDRRSVGNEAAVGEMVVATGEAHSPSVAGSVSGGESTPPLSVAEVLVA